MEVKNKQQTERYITNNVEKKTHFPLFVIYTIQTNIQQMRNGHRRTHQV